MDASPIDRDPRHVDATSQTARVDPIVMPAGGRDVPVTAADGTRLHVTVYGPDGAPAIILMHGITQQQLTWAYQAADLAGDHRVITYDHRGHGRSGWADDYSMDALGDDLQAVLDATLAPGEKAVLAGHSMGGITIMSWAKRHPVRVSERAAAVVLVNTAPSEIGLHVGLLGVPRRVHPLAKYVVRKRLLNVLTTRGHGAIRMLAFGPHAHPEHVREVVRLIGMNTRGTLRGFLVAVIDMDVSAGLPNLTCPTVIIAGQKDRLLPPVHNRRMGPLLPNLERMIMIPEGGHMGPWQEREIVTEALRGAATKHLTRS
jgi:pimeloyl-ACP methyl ester carboxylesterase